MGGLSQPFTQGRVVHPCRLGHHLLLGHFADANQSVTHIRRQWDRFVGFRVGKFSSHPQPINREMDHMPILGGQFRGAHESV